MNSLAEYFHTDWAAMTATDWFGTLLTVAITVLMALAYFQVFRPKNREALEARKYLPFAEERFEQNPFEQNPFEQNPVEQNGPDGQDDRNGGGHG